MSTRRFPSPVVETSLPINTAVADELVSWNDALGTVVKSSGILTNGVDSLLVPTGKKIIFGDTNNFALDLSVVSDKVTLKQAGVAITDFVIDSPIYINTNAGSEGYALVMGTAGSGELGKTQVEMNAVYTSTNAGIVAGSYAQRAFAEVDSTHTLASRRFYGMSGTAIKQSANTTNYTSTVQGGSFVGNTSGVSLQGSGSVSMASAYATRSVTWNGGVSVTDFAAYRSVGGSLGSSHTITTLKHFEAQDITSGTVTDQIGLCVRNLTGGTGAYAIALEGLGFRAGIHFNWVSGGSGEYIASGAADYLDFHTTTGHRVFINGAEKFYFGSGKFRPSVSSLDLGDSTNRFDNVFANKLDVGTDNTIETSATNLKITCAGNAYLYIGATQYFNWGAAKFNPTQSSVDLGDATNRWDDLFLSGNIDIDSGNLITDTTTGTKLATSNLQKLGFWGATPVIRDTGWSVANGVSTKSLDLASYDLKTVARVLGTLIETLESYGVIE